MESKIIEPTSLNLSIMEYGKIVRQYSDVDKSRFDATCKTIINEHLDRYSKQKENEVKNITINIYTY